MCVYQRSEFFLYLPFHFMQPLNPCAALASTRELNPCSWRFYSQYFSQRLPSSIYSHLCSFLFHQKRKYSFYTQCGSNSTTSVAFFFVLFYGYFVAGYISCVSSSVHRLQRLKLPKFIRESIFVFHIVHKSVVVALNVWLNRSGQIVFSNLSTLSIIIRNYYSSTRACV